MLVLVAVVGFFGWNELDKAAVDKLNGRGKGTGARLEAFFKATGTKSHATPEDRTKALDALDAELLALVGTSSIAGPGFLYREELVRGDRKQRVWDAVLYAASAAGRPDLAAFKERIGRVEALLLPADPKLEFLSGQVAVLKNLLADLEKSPDPKAQREAFNFFLMGLRSGFGM